MPDVSSNTIAIPLRCSNPDCCENSAAAIPKFDFAATTDSPVCPKCGGDGRTEGSTVRPIAVIHYILIDPVKGKIRTANGRRSVACCPESREIPTSTRKMLRFEDDKPERNATGEPSSVTCPACRETSQWKSDFVSGSIQHADIVKL